MYKIYERIAQLNVEGKAYVLCTLVGKRGSAPQEVGAKMLVVHEGLLDGTVGGGKLENYCLERAKQILFNSEKPKLETVNLQKDIKMSCGGEVDLFFEGSHVFKWQVAVFGAGHISQELCRVMQTWSCQVRVFDTRPEWVARLPVSANIFAKVSDDLADEVKNLPKGCFVTVMTQGHQTDLPVLEQLLLQHEKFPFIGVIGSQVKSIKLKNELKAKGVSELALKRLNCPLGMEFGDNTPPEIAISISAQLLSIRDNIEAAGQFLQTPDTVVASPPCL